MVAQGAALPRQRRGARLGQQRQVDTEARVRPLRAGDGLEDEIHRRAALDRLDLACNMCEHAGLGGNAVAFSDIVHQVQQRDDGLQAVRGGIDADDSVAVSV